MYPNRTKNTERRASPNADAWLGLGWGGVDNPPIMVTAGNGDSSMSEMI